MLLLWPKIVYWLKRSWLWLSLILGAVGTIIAIILWRLWIVDRTKHEPTKAELKIDNIVLKHDAAVAQARIDHAVAVAKAKGREEEIEARVVKAKELPLDEQAEEMTDILNQLYGR